MNRFNCCENLPCINRRFRYLVRVAGNRDRQLMISGAILAVICIALVINLAIMLTNDASNEEKNDSNETTSNPITDETTSSPIKKETTSSSMENKTTDVPDTASTDLPYIVPTMTNHKEMHINRSLAGPLEYGSTGRPLENHLYSNMNHFSPAIGYVNSVSLRLFSEWKGNVPLYLFAISTLTGSYKISHRYAVTPQRNTTEWQTIIIPLPALSIRVGNLLAVGIQESSDSNDKNQIYTVKPATGLCGKNINENTTMFNVEFNCGGGIAFCYTMIYYNK